METTKLILSILGALFGATALVWRIVDEFGSYLRIGVKTEITQATSVKLYTTVDNKGFRPKRISKAFILVGPMSENPIKTMNILFPNKNIKYTNDIAKINLRGDIIENERAVLYLGFYSDENVDIADETLSYGCIMNSSSFKKGVSYSVRFYVFSENWLHRSTHDGFIIPNID